MKYFITVIAIALAGCGFARRDVEVARFVPATGSTPAYAETSRESTTIWTIFKEIELGRYKSTNNDVNLYTPWFMLKGEK